MDGKVAVVTGANKGIGFAIVRGLCKRFNGVVYLTSRDIARGKQAAADLEKEGLHPKYHQLDIADTKSIETFRDHIKNSYGGIGTSILVNNAGIAFKHDSAEPIGVQAEVTCRLNYFSLVNTCDILFPILRQGARVVNLSSAVGHLSFIPSQTIRDRFKDPNLTVEGLSALVQEFVDAAKRGADIKDTFSEWTYAVSKVAIVALTMIQNRMLKDRGELLIWVGTYLILL